VSDPARTLDRPELDPDPLAQFGSWFQDARAAGERYPEAVALATATPAGRPSARMVLVKSWDERGLVFHTGYESRKGRELEENPVAALLFYWYAAGRQVRVEGAVDRTTRDESNAYFSSRPVGARFSALASQQSRPVGSREELEARVASLRAEHGEDPPLPDHWGGYRLRPELWEFWQHRDDRLHDRFVYERRGDGWHISRLQP
jgi:pyridoxamine 5'-phosphate oxidase